MPRRGAALAELAEEVNADDDELLPEARIFHNALMRRNEAVQNPIHYSRYLAKELEKQESKELEWKKKSESEGSDCEGEKKRKSKRKRNSCKKKSSKPKRRSSRRTIERESDNASSDKILLDAGHSSSDSSSTCIVLSKRAQNRLKKLREKHERDRQLFDKALHHESSDSGDNISCVYDDAERGNRDINLKIRVHGRLLKKVIKRAENFSGVYKFVAEECKAEVSQIRLYFQECLIAVEDTPHKLGLSLADIIDCLVFDVPDTASQNVNVIDIKIQSKDSKVKTTVSIHKLEPLSIMMQKYATEKNLPLNKLVFEFDGEKILPDQTSGDLEMESGSCVDVKIL